MAAVTTHSAPKEDGDTAVTKFREGRWWYPTTYRGADGGTKGTYVNVCTPVELFPDAIRYVDLYVDVIKRPDGSVEVVDADELEAAVDEGWSAKTWRRRRKVSRRQSNARSRSERLGFRFVSIGSSAAASASATSTVGSKWA